MTIEEEEAINAHIWKSREFAYISLSSTLARNKYFYDISLIGLARYGNVLCKLLGNDDVVGFTKILHHIGLKFEYVASGIKLTENAKLEYKENRMNKKPAIIFSSNHERKFNSLGKKEPDEGKLGWAEKILLNNKKEQEKQ
ncbi:hypothetical protein [Flavobacterium anhuiense]|uniref:hypothetical protein n=1 Tax=Flavobacterium anhuiense TaxID=459526 RepID=UPI002025BE3B|nr:hypothetical protein [Flavobacterium anhuiense]URM37153.1 hypothetical protein LLY39_00750 [Flavobacterium anhuiense]